MPAPTQERALEAAVELLGSEGVRALTHARVDDRADLPPGSTSNWFRTRRALLGGLADWIAARELADLGSALTQRVASVEELVDVLCTAVELQSGPFAARTRARYALFLELADDPELGQALRDLRHAFERWAERVVADVGVADPVPAARVLMAVADGLLLHRLTVDPTLQVRPAVRRAVVAVAAA